MGGIVTFWVVLCAVVAVCIYLYAFRKVIVFQYERGLLYTKGKFKKVLEPGKYRYWGFNSTVTKHDVRVNYITIPGQEVLTKDGISIKISLAAEYVVKNINVAVNDYENYVQALYLEIQMVLRGLVGDLMADELLEKRGVLSEDLESQSCSKAEKIGLEIRSVNIKDIMFPGSLKDIFSNVLKAQKQTQADLEKARGQTACLRHLANAAKMMDKNPSLLNLRLIQAVSEGSGNTIVLKMSEDNSLSLEENN